MTDRHLISVDELRAAGALDVPPAWRKSLAPARKKKERLLFDDDDFADEPAAKASEAVDAAGESAAGDADDESEAESV